RDRGWASEDRKRQDRQEGTARNACGLRSRWNESRGMSYVRIVEFTDRPATPSGEWYAPDGRPGSVRVDRGDAALAPADTDTGRLTTTWTGVRVYRGGTERKGSIVYMLKYPVPFDYLYEFDAWFRYEHMPMLFEEPAWYGCELFRALGASSYTF